MENQNSDSQLRKFILDFNLPDQAILSVHNQIFNGLDSDQKGFFENNILSNPNIAKACLYTYSPVNEYGLRMKLLGKYTFDQYKIAALNERMNAENQKAIKRLGENLVHEVATWALENLSEYQISQMSTYQMARLMVENDPGRLTSEQIGKFFGKDGNLLPEIQSAFDAPLRRPDAQHYNETGNVRELQRPRKAKPAPPKLPTYKELAKMESEDIAELLKQLHAAGVGIEE